MKTHISSAPFIGLLATLLCLPALATNPDIRIVAVTGAAAPVPAGEPAALFTDVEELNNGTHDDARIDDLGRVAFFGATAAGRGLYYSSPNVSGQTDLDLILRNGDEVSDMFPGYLVSFMSQMAANNAGDVAFLGITDSSEIIIRWNKTNGLVVSMANTFEKWFIMPVHPNALYVLNPQPVFLYPGFTGNWVTSFEWWVPQINDQGKLLVDANLRTIYDYHYPGETIFPTSAWHALIANGRQGSNQAVLSNGTPNSSASETWQVNWTASGSSLSRLAGDKWAAVYTVSAPNAPVDHAGSYRYWRNIYRGTLTGGTAGGGGTVLHRASLSDGAIIWTGGGGGIYPEGEFSDLILNQNGDLIFRATVRTLAGDYEERYLVSRTTGAPFQLLKPGDQVAGKTVASHQPLQWSGDDILVFIQFTDASVALALVTNSAADVRILAQPGTSLPGGDTLTASFMLGYAEKVAADDLGGVAFWGSPAMGDNALFHRSPDGVMTRIIGNGDAFLGSYVNQFHLSTAHSLNGLGQLLFSFQLGDGRKGLAVATLPSAYRSGIVGYGLDGSDIGPSDDPDGDGNSNATEITDGTNPVSAASFLPRLSVHAENGSVTIALQQASYTAGQIISLTAVPEPGYVFYEWQGDATGQSSVINVIMDRTRQVTALFLTPYDAWIRGFGLAQYELGQASDPDGDGVTNGVEYDEGTNPSNAESIAIAVDAPSLSFTTGGNAPWFPQTAVVKIGVSAARAGAIANSQQSWFETTVNGSGKIRFWWKVSSEFNRDFLEFWKDGVKLAGSLSGTVDWVQREETIVEAGAHTFRWRYAKNNSFFSGSDTGWVDGIEWIPEPGLGSWAAAAGLTGPNAAPAAMPHNDGVPNLLKYAFNMNGAGPDVSVMASAGTSGLPDVSFPVGSSLRIEFVRRIGSGLVYTPKMNATLAPGSWTPLPSPIVIVTPINAAWERVVCEQPFDTSFTPQLFGTVEVTLP